jgi:short chain dehydrogenase
LNKLKSTLNLCGFNDADEVAKAVFYSASDDSAIVPASEIVVDGGVTGSPRVPPISEADKRLPGRTKALSGGKTMTLAKLFDLSGHFAVVTGGNGGIGRSVALGLAQAGAAVAVLARNEGKNQTVLGELKAVGSPALALSVDVTVERQLQSALQQVEQTLGSVSVLVNNAGIAAFGKGVLEHCASSPIIRKSNVYGSLVIS